MAIYNGDVRTHRPPAGWTFMSQEPQVLVDLDAEVWYLARVSV